MWTLARVELESMGDFCNVKGVVGEPFDVKEWFGEGHQGTNFVR